MTARELIEKIKNEYPGAWPYVNLLIALSKDDATKAKLPKFNDDDEMLKEDEL